jgi:hypothetical protein
MLRMIIRRLLGAARLTTSECSRQSRRQASLPPVSLLIRSIGPMKRCQNGDHREKRNRRKKVFNLPSMEGIAGISN